MMQFFANNYIWLTAVFAVLYILFSALTKKRAKKKKCPSCGAMLKFNRRYTDQLKNVEIDVFDCSGCKREVAFPVKGSRGAR